MTLYDVVEESQTSALASQRTVANAGKVGIGVETVTVEDSHNAKVLHVTIGNNGIKDNLPVLIYILQFMPRYMFEKL